MVKECRVILRNPVNMVVLFGDIEVQMPSNNGVSSVVYIKYEDNKYTLSSKDEYDKELCSNKKIKVKPNIENDSLEEKY